MATKKDPISPIAKREYSYAEKAKLLFTISSPAAARRVGLAIKKENSTATFLFAPKNNAPMIVDAARETPGIIAIAWQQPIRND